MEKTGALHQMTPRNVLGSWVYEFAGCMNWEMYDEFKEEPKIFILES